MPKLSKIVAPALLASLALGVAMPAQAQPFSGRDRPHYGYVDSGRVEAMRAQIDDLQRRIDGNAWRGRISDREASRLRMQVYRLRDEFRGLSRHGLSRDETRMLQNRIDTLRVRLQFERQNRDHRRW
ncbi:MAG: hypothetical protein JF593_14260 [Novosphingobium sp.]|nr:hypothetical protein [Novosphingobium sp.]